MVLDAAANKEVETIATSTRASSTALTSFLNNDNNIMSSPHSTGSNHNFFPTSQTTPDHASANAMLAARKQQLAHLQTLQRQQQEVLQQMSARNHAASASSHPAAAPAAGGYGNYAAADGRDDRFSAGGLRSHPGSPVGSAVGASSVVSFANAGGASAYGRHNSAASMGAPASPRSSGGRPAFECDYDTNPTDLYLCVQRKDWDGAVERAAACPHEASTWVSRKEGDGKLRWRLLPLHAAIIFRAPERTVSTLLLAFAQGAACKDDQGMLPLHLAFRNGCESDVVHLLLMAYPQSVDVQDRKGRTPMVLAQQSTHPNRESYIRALERGPAYYAVANAAKDGIVGSPGGAHAGYGTPGAGASSLASYGVPAMPPTMPAAFPSLTDRGASANNLAAAAAAQTNYGGNAGNDDRVADLEAELAKTQETSQVLVDHVNSLEAQLASRSDTERFLATKIANLDSQLKESNARLEMAGAEAEVKDGELAKKDVEANERAKTAEEEVARLQVALADKKEAELRSYKLTNKERFDIEDKVETLERDCAGAQANAAVLEAQLKKKIETEQSLASQVSMLASQLASSASSSSEASSAYQRRCESLAAENKKLQGQVDSLEGKLGTVAAALDAMAAEQERIVEAATKHERTMASCAKANTAIVEDTTRQETLLEDAAKEREQIVSILMRQAEDAERTMADREKVLEAVKRQEEDIAEAACERDSVVDSVNRQREYMDFMLNGELQFLKRTASEDECPLVQEDKQESMERMKQEYFENKEEETGDVEAEEEEAAEEVSAGEETSETAGAPNEPAIVEEEVDAAIEDDEEEEVDAAIEDDEEEEEDVAAQEEDEEAVEEDSGEDEEDDDSDEEEDAALEEAANAVKAAMAAAEDVVARDVDGYETPAEEEEEEEDDDDISAAVSAASSHDSADQRND